MIEPLNIVREEFPKSEKRSEGMKILEKKYGIIVMLYIH